MTRKSGSSVRVGVDSAPADTGGAVQATRRTIPGLRLSRLWALPALIPVFLLRYLAVGVGAYYAFTSWNGVSVQADFVGLANFRRLFSDEVARQAVWNTLILSSTAVILSNVFGMLLALSLNRLLRTRQLLRSMFFAPFAMTPLAVSYVWAYILDYDGLLNRALGWVGLSSWRHAWIGDPDTAIWTILVVLVWQLSGLCMIIYLSGLQGVPEEVIEASELDGAGQFATFRHVLLPLLNPAIVVAVALPTIMTLRVFDQVIGLTNGGPAQATETLATQVYRQSFVSGDYGYGAAIALMLTAVIAVVSLAQIFILRRR